MNVWLLGTFKNIIGINGGAMILHSIVNAFYKLIIKKNMFILFLGTFYYICNIKEYHTINIEKNYVDYCTHYMCAINVNSLRTGITNLQIPH